MGDLDRFLNPSGRISLRVLEQLAATHDRASFGRILGRPVLAGSSVQAGAITERQASSRQAVNQTFVFQIQPPPDPLAEPESVTDMLKHAIYPLVKSSDTGRASNIFTIGRVNQNDLIIPDLAISKRHAILEIQAEGYFIRDSNSTNGTWLNGARLDEQRRAIRDGDSIAFARYEFSFLLPDSLYQRLTGG